MESYEGTLFLLKDLMHSSTCLSVILGSKSEPDDSGGYTDVTYEVSIDTAGTLGKNHYSAVLAAAHAGKKIGFGVSGCHIDRPKMYRVDVKF